MALISTRGLSTKPLPSVVLLMGYLLAFCALAACLAYWGMQLFAPPAPIASSGVVAEKTASLDLTATGKLFGSAASPQQIATVAAPPINVKIVGLMASNQTARASAVLTIDNRPAVAFAIGDYLGNNTKLVDITGAGITIEQSGNRTRVDAPPIPTIASLSKPTSAPGTKPIDASQPRSSIALPAGGGNSSGGAYLPPPAPATPVPFVQPAPVTPTLNTQPITPPQMQLPAGSQGMQANPNDGNSQPAMPIGGATVGRPR
jgi:general secretion pathway protein C